MSRERIAAFFDMSREMYPRASSGNFLRVNSRYPESFRFLGLWCEPDHNVGDDHHLHQQDGGFAFTSDINMINILLVICQMVPFAEVILLTAMEYIREEKQKGKKTKRKGGQTISLVVAPVEENAFIDENQTEKLGFNWECGIPNLKTLDENTPPRQTNVDPALDPKMGPNLISLKK